jgi:hypothetical protein
MNQIIGALGLSRFSFPARKRAGLRSSPIKPPKRKTVVLKRNYFVKCLYNLQLFSAF